MKKSFVTAALLATAGALYFTTNKKAHAPETPPAQQAAEVSNVTTSSPAMPEQISVGQTEEFTETNAPAFSAQEKPAVFSSPAIETARLNGVVTAKPSSPQEASLMAAHVIARKTPADVAIFSATPADGAAYVVATDNPVVLSNALFAVTYGGGLTQTYPLAPFETEARADSATTSLSNIFAQTAEQMSDRFNPGVPAIVPHHFSNISAMGVGIKSPNFGRPGTTVQRAAIITIDGTELTLFQRPRPPGARVEPDSRKHPNEPVVVGPESKLIIVP